jgi:uncharacterized protein
MLPFWHFFHQIETELSYERWIDKYKIFLDTLQSGVVPLNEADNYATFRQFCRVLYLQDIRHESRFDALLDAAILTEEKFLQDLISAKELLKDAEKSPEKPTNNSQIDKPVFPTGTTVSGNSSNSETTTPRRRAKTTEQFFEPQFRNTFSLDQSSNPQNAKRSENYLHTDEFLPVTRREMTKAWQYFRRKENKGPSTQIDILATALHIARKGGFTEPIFHKQVANRSGSLFIFADMRGSMTPFHEMVRRFVATAQAEGGATPVPVFYFQNVPSGFVFLEPNLSTPIRLADAVKSANRLLSLAIIISDAGAARGSSDPLRRAHRGDATQQFLSVISEHMAHTLWLNPLPRHRWADTAAADITDLPNTLMVPIFDADAFNFQDEMRLALKKLC